MLWLAGRQYLSPPSQQTPFNHVQHLYYYTTLNSWMPQHRDNNNKRDFECAWEAQCAGERVVASTSGTCVGIESVNSQVAG